MSDISDVIPSQKNKPCTDWLLIFMTTEGGGGGGLTRRLSHCFGVQPTLEWSKNLF